MTKAIRKASDEAIERGTALRVEQFDGAVAVDASVRVTQTRWEARILRARPGTFEWRYGRKTADSALYHAGIRFAELWEIAGTADASSPDLTASGKGSGWRDIPARRMEAMQAIAKARQDIGKWGTARLVDYCVIGTASSVMAERYGLDERAMSHVLDSDLRAAAEHFRLR